MARGGGKGEQGEDYPWREARSSCSRKSPPSFPLRKRGDGGSSCEGKALVFQRPSAFPTARHQLEETTAARLPLGQ